MVPSTTSNNATNTLYTHTTALPTHLPFKSHTHTPLTHTQTHTGMHTHSHLHIHTLSLSHTHTHTHTLTQSFIPALKAQKVWAKPLSKK